MTSEPRTRPIPKEWEDGAAYNCSIHTHGERGVLNRCDNAAIGILREDLAEMLNNWTRNDREFRRQFYCPPSRYFLICRPHFTELFGD